MTVIVISGLGEQVNSTVERQREQYAFVDYNWGSVQSKCKLLRDTLKSNKETSCYLGWSKCLPFQFPSSNDRFYRYIGVKFTFVLLDCVRYIGDIVIPWVLYILL